jgi:hypothetical protein
LTRVDWVEEEGAGRGEGEVGEDRVTGETEGIYEVEKWSARLGWNHGRRGEEGGTRK